MVAPAVSARWTTARVSRGSDIPMRTVGTASVAKCIRPPRSGSV